MMLHIYKGSDLVYYLIFEDSTSCMDLTLQLLKTNVTGFSSICKYYSVCGAPQAGDVFSDLVNYGEADIYINRIQQSNIVEHVHVRPDDVFIFIVDSTVKISKIGISSDRNILGTKIYRTTYYCFESCPFSYSRFNSEIFGKTSETDKYLAMQKAICSTSYPTLETAKEYIRKYSPSSKQKTMESLATSLFASYMQNMKCVKLNKHAHTALAECLGSDTLRFYTNNCDPTCEYCMERHQLDRTSNYCTFQMQANNLLDFYYNSIWSQPLECVYGGQDRSLLEIFNESKTSYFI